MNKNISKKYLEMEIILEQIKIFFKKYYLNIIKSDSMTCSRDA